LSEVLVMGCEPAAQDVGVAPVCPAGPAFLDVDGLKRVNDEHGHDVGDMLLSDVARVLRATLRESDIVGRMGGDEFCVLVTKPTGDTAILKRRLVEAFRCFN
jgi:diguanylate cyclase (GGDEF)-like protein